MKSFSRVVLRAEQNCRKCGMSSTVWQDDNILQCSDGLLDQWLHSASVRNLPETNLACTDAIAILVGEELAVVQIG